MIFSGSALVNLARFLGLDIALEVSDASTAAIRFVKKRMEHNHWGYATFNELDGLGCAHLTDQTVMEIWEGCASRPVQFSYFHLEQVLYLLAAEYIVRRTGLRREEILLPAVYGYREVPWPNMNEISAAKECLRQLESGADAPLKLAIDLWYDALYGLYRRQVNPFDAKHPQSWRG